MNALTRSDALTTTPETGLAARLPLAGRALFALPFGVFGALHLAAGPAMAGMVPVPGGVFWVYLTGVAMLAAAVSIATGRLAKISSPLLALLLAVYVVTLHLPGLGDPATQQTALMGALKDTGLIGGALLAWADALRRG